MIFRAHGRFVDSLKGRYITAEDVGTSVEDMDYVRHGDPVRRRLAGGSGDPSPVTAYGTYRGIKACAKEQYGSDSLERCDHRRAGARARRLLSVRVPERTRARS